jgi:hypothetical protein
MHTWNDGGIADFMKHVNGNGFGGIDTYSGRGALLVASAGPGLGLAYRLNPPAGRQVRGYHGIGGVSSLKGDDFLLDDPYNHIKSALFWTQQSHFDSLVLENSTLVGRDIVNGREGSDGVPSVHTHTTIFGPESIGRDLSSNVQQHQKGKGSARSVRYDPEIFTRTGRLMVNSYHNFETARYDDHYSRAVEKVDDIVEGIMHDYPDGPLIIGLRGDRGSRRSLIGAVIDCLDMQEKALKDGSLRRTSPEYKSAQNLWKAVGDQGCSVLGTISFGLSPRESRFGFSV